MFNQAFPRIEAELKSAILPDPLVAAPTTAVMVAISQMSGVCTSHPARSCCVVIVQDQQVVGLFTERDVVCLVGQHQPLEVLTLSQFCNHPPITYPESALINLGNNLGDLLKLLQQIQYLPIVNGQNQLTGLMTYESLQRVSMEAELAASEAKFRRLRHLIEDGNDLIWEIDRNSCFTYLSPQFQTLFGWKPDEWLGQPSLLLLHPDDLLSYFGIENPNNLADMLAAYQAYLQSGRYIDQYEFRHRCRDGHYRWVSVSCKIMRNSNREIIGAQGIISDISDRKKAEAQLRRTNEELACATRLKDEFLANMSHELRTPLNAILGMTEVLQDQIHGTLNDRQLKALSMVESSSNHLLELINDILDVAKIESEQAELEYSSVDIRHLCESSLAFIKQQAVNKQLKLDVQLPEQLPSLYIDERRMRQVLINLLNNAVKFTPEGGQITLMISYPIEIRMTSVGMLAGIESFLSEQTLENQTHTDGLQISILDTGIGIAPENVPKLFQPFIQIDSALNRQYSGTGLGLALVKRIVELHGGNVKLTSEIGVGSCFTIELPCQF